MIRLSWILDTCWADLIESRVTQIEGSGLGVAKIKIMSPIWERPENCRMKYLNEEGGEKGHRLTGTQIEIHNKPFRMIKCSMNSYRNKSAKMRMAQFDIHSWTLSSDEN